LYIYFIEIIMDIYFIEIIVHCINLIKFLSYYDINIVALNTTK
jgi:hypothetical protein